MAASGLQPLMPLALHKEGDDRLVIQWNDGHHSIYTWQHLRKHCPCAACREERLRPPELFPILKAADLTPLPPLAAVSMPPIGRYGYKIIWNDGHDTGIYPLEV